MRRFTAFLLGTTFAGLAFAAGCTSTTTAPPAPTPKPACTPCLKDSECGGGLCGQFGGDAYCAPDCSNGQACASGTVCMPVNSTEDVKSMLCVPRNACPATTTTTTSTGSTGTGGQGGSAGTGGQGGTVDIGVSGGKLPVLSFAIVGDTRPPSEDDTTAYPTPIITKIWQDVEAAKPRPPFAIATGDYQFADPSGAQSPIQLGLYTTARAAFSGSFFPAMGNHECTGGTASQCGKGNPDGITSNYTNFMTKLLGPIGVTTPYYVMSVNSTTGAWTAKFVFIAANAWTTAQGTWLTQTLAVPTTYTFIVRHESSTTSGVNGVTASAPIIANSSYTLLIVGHTHTYEYRPSTKEVIVGNGGAPLGGSVDYGYVIATQRADGAMSFTEYDYMTNTANQTFVVAPNGAETN